VDRGGTVTVSIITGLLVQAVAIWIVQVAIRGDWLRRPGALLVATAVLGHGVTEVMQWMWPGRNVFYRRWVDQGEIDNWILLASFAILVYAITYVMVVSRKPQRPLADPTVQIEGLHLKWLFVAVAPLLFLTWQGRGALTPVAPGDTASRENYASVGLASTFLVPLIAVIGAIILVRYGTRRMILLFLVIGIALSLAGTRTMIITACLLSLIGAALCGVKPTRKQVAWMVVLMAFFTVLISATRSVAGRETFTAGRPASERIDGLIEGLGALGEPESREAILDDIVYRFDCNTFGAMVLESLNHSVEPVGLVTVKNAALLTVPSFLDTNKLGKPLEERSEEAYLDRRFGIKQTVDWLPGMFGAMLSYYGPEGLPVLALILGLLVGLGERFLQRLPTNARFVAAIGAAQCALIYGGGTHDIIVSLRGTLLCVGSLWLIGICRRTLKSFQATSSGASGHTITP
jgi:hypothetical protein